jgi:hypothetical protein
MSSSKDILYLTLGLCALLIVLLVFLSLLLRQRQMRERYDLEHHKAVLSIFRENYEDKIADLNSRLLATEDRWKDVNHLLLDSQRNLPENSVRSRVDSGRFLRQFGISIAQVEVDPKLIMTLTPFSKREAATYRVIQDVCQRFGFRCVRGDEEFVAGEILPHVVDLIVRARLVIANISGRNANVYYELGIAHALGKPTILLSRSLEEVPFDLRAKYVVLFEKGDDLNERLRDAIARLLAEMEPLPSIARSDHEPDKYNLSLEAQRLLIEASKDTQGTIMQARWMGGETIQANGINFVEGADARQIAKWRAALDQLRLNRLVEQRGGSGEVLYVTDAGYQLAESLQHDRAP